MNHYPNFLNQGQDITRNMRISEDKISYINSESVIKPSNKVIFYSSKTKQSKL